MKGLSILGTAAMFLVGGGILLHGITVAHELVQYLNAISFLSRIPHGILEILWNAIFGVIVGMLLLALIEGYKKLFARFA